jgi:hypothetical protein
MIFTIREFLDFYEVPFTRGWLPSLTLTHQFHPRTQTKFGLSSIIKLASLKFGSILSPLS